MSIRSCRARHHSLESKSGVHVRLVEVGTPPLHNGKSLDTPEIENNNTTFGLLLALHLYRFLPILREITSKTLISLRGLQEESQQLNRCALNMAEEDDLSPYERLRLERIKRNLARLAALGLNRSIKSPVGGGKSVHNSAAVPRTQTKREKRIRVSAPNRCSARLLEQQKQIDLGREPLVSREKEAGIGINREGEKSPKADEGKEDYAGAAFVAPVDRSRLPREPDELDDNEFQVYASLRRWRLRRKSELDVEPYKICQNRTLCEMIRMRRDDPGWGAPAHLDGRAKDENAVTEELLECWGIGESKAQPGGFGPEMIRVLEGGEELLASSRKLP